jgi:hypothetical protein
MIGCGRRAAGQAAGAEREAAPTWATNCFLETRTHVPSTASPDWDMDEAKDLVVQFYGIPIEAWTEVPHVFA